MYLLLTFLPLLSSISLLVFGRLLGRLGASMLSIFVIFFCFFSSLLVFYEVALLSVGVVITLPVVWFSVDILNIE